MKKIVITLFVLLLITFSSNAFSQGFTFRNLGPVFVNLPYIPDSIQVVKRQSIVSNQSATPINFRFARIVNDMPPGWYTQMCYDLCYAPFIDTISLPFDPPYVLQPNQTDTLFYIDFSCTGQGLGTAMVKMFNTDNPSQYVIDTFKVQIGGVGISNISSDVEGYELMQNFPNPFNPTTKIKFSLAAAGEVSLRVFDSMGRMVREIADNLKLSAGKYSVDFNAQDLTSGVYYYTITAGDFSDTKKMLLIK
jgi:hypothetical protein